MYAHLQLLRERPDEDREAVRRHARQPGSSLSRGALQQGGAGVPQLGEGPEDHYQALMDEREREREGGGC